MSRILLHKPYFYLLLLLLHLLVLLFLPSGAAVCAQHIRRLPKGASKA